MNIQGAWHKRLYNRTVDKNMKSKLLIPALLLISSTALAQPPQKRPFTFEDMMKLKRVGVPVPSPDGKWVVFDCVDVDLEANTRISHLWIVPANGPAAAGRRLNPTPNHEERPRFSPDGKRLIWTSKATDPTQIWMCDFDSNAGALTGKPHQVTEISTGTAATTPRDLTPGDHDVPPFSLGGQDMYAISPDGQEIAYTSNIDEVEATSTNNEIFVVPISGPATAGKKISTSPGADTTPLYSPDGKYLAWRSQARAGFEADKWRLLMQDRQSGKTRDATENFDLSVGSYVWEPSGLMLFFSYETSGQAVFGQIVPSMWGDEKNAVVIPPSGQPNWHVGIHD